MNKNLIIKLSILITLLLIIGGCNNMATIKPLSGELKNVFEIEKGLTDYALTHPINVKNTLIKEHDISDTTLLKGSFINTNWDDVVYQNAIISNVLFKDGDMYDISFADSTLTNVVFDNMVIEKAEFINAKLINVTFKNCKIFDSEIRNLRTSKIIIENSQLQKVSFFESELDITIKNTKIHEQGEFLGLKAGSKILIEDSLIGPYSEFDHSNLLSFIVRNSVIKNSKMNNSTVDEIVIENTKMDFALSGGTFNTVKLINNEEFVSLGRAKFNSLIIDDCKDDFGISLRKTAFKTISVRSCPFEIINVSKAKGEKLSISSSNIREAKFNNLAVKELILNNVKITNIANFSGALAEESKLTNFSIKSGTKINMEGTNIKFQ